MAIFEEAVMGAQEAFYASVTPEESSKIWDEQMNLLDELSRRCQNSSIHHVLLCPPGHCRRYSENTTKSSL